MDSRNYTKQSSDPNRSSGYQGSRRSSYPNDDSSARNDGKFSFCPKILNIIGTNIYIANISSDIDTRDFEKHFAKFGPIAGSILIKDRKNG